MDFGNGQTARGPGNEFGRLISLGFPKSWICGFRRPWKRWRAKFGQGLARFREIGLTGMTQRHASENIDTVENEKKRVQDSDLSAWSLKAWDREPQETNLKILVPQPFQPNSDQRSKQSSRKPCPISLHMSNPMIIRFKAQFIQRADMTKVITPAELRAMRITDDAWRDVDIRNCWGKSEKILPERDSTSSHPLTQKNKFRPHSISWSLVGGLGQKSDGDRNTRRNSSQFNPVHENICHGDRRMMSTVQRMSR